MKFTVRLNLIILLVISTVILSIYDFYIVGKSFPVKIYYLPIFFLPLIFYLAHPAFKVKLNIFLILLFLLYISLIVISYYKSSYKFTFGLKSPLIFIFGVLTVALTFTSFFILFDKNHHFETLKKALFLSVLINAVISILLLISTNIFHVNIGTILPYHEYIRLSGFYVEPDLFGFYTSCIALLFLPICKKTNIFRLNLINASFWINTILNILTITRTTLISELICVIFYYLSKKKIIRILQLTLIMVIFFTMGSIFNESKIMSRFGNKSTEKDSGAWNSRVLSIAINVSEIKKSFFWGSGPGYLFDLSTTHETRKNFGITGGDVNVNRSGTIFFLGEIFNTGAIGLVIVLIFFIIIWKTLGYYGIKKDTISKNNYDYLFFLEGVRLVFLNSIIVSFSNTVVKMVFIWVFLGIGCKIAVQHKREFSKKLCQLNNGLSENGMSHPESYITK
jgi:hypothetical protein